ncbi:MAG: hypothetical protein U0521_28155 [Anaerolineae bacterium]
MPLLYQATQVTDAPLPAALCRLGRSCPARASDALLGRMIIWIVFGIAVGRRRYGIALAAGAIILLLHSLYSHASATYDLIPAVVGDWLHLTATAFWVGGLIQFLNVLKRSARERSAARPADGALLQLCPRERRRVGRHRLVRRVAGSWLGRRAVQHAYGRARCWSS